MVMGLNRLSDPMLVPQMARLIKDHDFFLGMLNECDQEKRTEMYEALKPHLSFKPWPLERYISKLKERAGNIASTEKPAVIGKRSKPFQIRGKQYIDAISREAGAVTCLTFTCAKCTRMEQFIADTPVQAAIMARQKGWVRDIVRDREICPKCPAVRTKVGNA